MEKFAIGTRVNVKFTPEARRNLGLDEVNHKDGSFTVKNHYSLGHYLTTHDGKTISVADKYNLITKGE